MTTVIAMGINYPAPTVAGDRRRYIVHSDELLSAFLVQPALLRLSAMISQCFNNALAKPAAPPTDREHRLE